MTEVYSFSEEQARKSGVLTNSILIHTFLLLTFMLLGTVVIYVIICDLWLERTLYIINEIQINLIALQLIMMGFPWPYGQLDLSHPLLY